jgi:peptidoglycan L-alanyl-D-glutamate endopeptidase CwlK
MKCRFSKRSIDNLKGVHPLLVKLMHACIQDPPVDFTITEGVRTATRQMELYQTGRSKCDGVHKKSNHQKKADGYGYAVDLYPLPIQYKDMKPYILLSKHIKDKAKELGIKISYGGDWKTFKDYPHYELR